MGREALAVHDPLFKRANKGPGGKRNSEDLEEIVPLNTLTTDLFS